MSSDCSDGGDSKEEEEEEEEAVEPSKVVSGQQHTSLQPFSVSCMLNLALVRRCAISMEVTKCNELSGEGGSTSTFSILFDICDGNIISRKG